MVKKLKIWKIVFLGCSLFESNSKGLNPYLVRNMIEIDGPIAVGPFLMCRLLRSGPVLKSLPLLLLLLLLLLLCRLYFSILAQY